MVMRLSALKTLLDTCSEVRGKIAVHVSCGRRPHRRRVEDDIKCVQHGENPGDFRMSAVTHRITRRNAQEIEASYAYVMSLVR